MKDTVKACEGWSFKTESELVDSFVGALLLGATCWGKVQLVTEWWHPSGATDVLVRTERRGLIAFEAKLSNWRVALHQAYRNTS